jgi:phenylacetate-CoA ligase
MDWLKTSYDRSPLWLQNLMVSAQGFFFNRKRWDVELGRELLARLLESQWWERERFEAYQLERLREHLTYATTQIPYYRERFKKGAIDPDAIGSLQDLRTIPLLEKDAIRREPTRFLRSGKLDRSWTRLFTSGTTGSPMDLYSSKESFTRIWSFVFRLRSWAGLSDPVFPRRVQFTGRNIVPDKKISDAKVYWRRNVPGNALLMSTTHLSQETVPEYVEAMKRFEPELVDGYPSALLMVARISSALGVVLPRPIAVITSAETLFPEDRHEIESAFGCRVFNQYASSDTGAFICDCEYGNLHINPEFGICEVLDPEGEPVPAGQEGEIVATSFCNLEQVFIRYKIGDCAVVGPTELCECGRMMPRIEAVTGRVDDILYMPDRGFVGRLDPIFKGLRGIYEAQVIHESLNVLRVNLVPDPTWDRSAEDLLVGHLREKVGQSVAIRVECVREIPRGPNGKFRSVINLCKEDYPGVRTS